MKERTDSDAHSSIRREEPEYSLFIKIEIRAKAFSIIICQGNSIDHGRSKSCYLEMQRAKEPPTLKDTTNKHLDIAKFSSKLIIIYYGLILGERYNTPLICYQLAEE